MLRSRRLRPLRAQDQTGITPVLIKVTLSLDLKTSTQLIYPPPPHTPTTNHKPVTRGFGSFTIVWDSVPYNRTLTFVVERECFIRK